MVNLRRIKIYRMTKNRIEVFYVETPNEYRILRLLIKEGTFRKKNYSILRTSCVHLHCD